MSASESDSGSDSDVPQESLLEEITLQSLKGRWRHSLGDYLTNKGDERVVFDQGTEFSLSVDGNTVSLDGWTAIPEKSTSNKITWTKEGEKAMYWRFEADLDEDEAEEGAEEVISNANIITGKRRRGAVDYAALNKKLEADGTGLDDDDGDADDIEARSRAKKKAKMDLLARSMKPASSSSFQPSSSSSSSSSSSAPAAAAAKKPVVKKLNNDELLRIREQLGVEGPLQGAVDALAALKRLERHPMELKDLKATKIGVVVNRYKKHADKAIQARVTALVKTWKKLLPAK